MTYLEIKLLSINDVKEFVTMATLCPFDTDLISGRYTVDAKSIMGIFSIVPSESLKLAIYAEPEECADFTAAVLGKFGV
ncbi:MAG: HPr family phosphocarrier protein [Clostridiales bacterium]|nr:HPr family phosphocarrier protein [Clostridiales bacterium]